MKQNVGTWDRIIRFLLAAVICYLYCTNVVSGTLGIGLMVVAIILALTGLVGFCPLYGILGMNSCEVKNEME